MKFIKRTDRRLTLILSVIRLSIIPCIILYFIIGNIAETVRLHKSLDMYNDSIAAVIECYDAYRESGDGGDYEKLVKSYTDSTLIFLRECSVRTDDGEFIGDVLRRISLDLNEDVESEKPYIHDLCRELKTVNESLSKTFGRTKTIFIFNPLISLHYRLHTY